LKKAVTRLVAISNRVATPQARGNAGAQGGLAGALSAALREAGGVWFGWSGQEVEDPADEPEIGTYEGVTMATIDLAPQDVEEYYNGYANSTLWPLFH
jgi:trehalose 6-phosphate synthase